MRLSFTAIPLAIVLTGCAVGPNYERPNVPAPITFRAPEPLPPDQAASLADLKWFEVFKDPELQNLVRSGLSQNYDLATPWPASNKRAPISASRAPISFRSLLLEETLTSPASRATARFLSRPIS
jgi:hypothetical protein